VQELTKGSMRMPDGSKLWWDMANGSRVYFVDFEGAETGTLVYNGVLEPFHLLTALNLEMSFRYAGDKLD